ncbi:uncharacterized protein LOC132286491 [Cornus florida]|uniref:uncharacterized protein LOC132286491 n=1 Tax=Cornus florida TaxID=4283 RepID=UPI00289FA179|nr:uncharacterized protein LOC132286491 [Cornus florida]
MRDSESATAMEETATNVGAKEEEEDPLGICFWVVREEAESTRCWRPATNICNSIPDDFKGHVIEAFQIKETKSGDCVLQARLINHTMDVQLLVEYNFNTNIWRTCSETNNFGTSYGARNVIFVDDILYSYVKNAATYLQHQGYCEDYNITRCSILCFDSNKPQAKPKEVIFSEKDLNLLPQPYDEEWNLFPPVNFLHLSGANFGLIWCHQQEWVGPNGDDHQLGVTCLKFTVSKKPLPLTSLSSSFEEQQVDFVASNVSQSVHLVNGMRVLGAIAISTSKEST